MINALGFDYETHLIGPDLCPCGEIHGQFPPPVCMSWALPDGRSDVVTPKQGLEVLDECLSDSSCMLVGAETAFDVFVSCVSSADFDAWIARWVAAYDEGRVFDVNLRQKMLDLAAGSYRWITHSDGRRLRIGYDLATTSKRATGRLLSKPTKETQATHPRLRYAEVDGVPIADWPEDFIEYAREDSVATIENFIVQQNWRDSQQGQVIEELWAGQSILPDAARPDPFADEQRQTFHALWLKAMSGEGLVTDPAALARFERVVRKEYVALAAEVRGYGLARREYWRDVKGMKAAGAKYGLGRDGNAAWRRLCAELDLDLPEAEAVWHELHGAGLVKSKHVKNMKAARSRMFDVCLRSHKPIPHTNKWDPDRGDAINEKIAIDSDACRLSEDNALIAYAELTHTAKMLTADIPQLRKGTDPRYPIHTHYESLLETGRISSARPNVTNRARGEGKEVKLRDGTTRPGRPGDRECFIPREGNVLVDTDYPQLELYALAQVCRWSLGYSTLGDVLTSDWVDEDGRTQHGKDPHTDFARYIVAAGGDELLSYTEAALALKQNGKKGKPLHRLHQAMKNARDAAKGCNFGKPGGLGAETMVGYAAKSYGVVRTEDQWRELFVLWDKQWPEMPDYFAFINSLETYSGSGEFLVPQMWSGRLRAGARYCAACNSFYQGLGADVAKRAGAYIFRACYLKGFDPVLFGCTPVNFIHDQTMVEAPEARAQECALRVEHWMRQAAIDVMPDYGPMMASKTEAILCRRWSKNAEAVRDEDGSLVAWEDERLLIDDFEDEDESAEDGEESEAA
jgi:hypothetical protein